MDAITLDLPVTPPILMRLHEDDELISQEIRCHQLWEAASSWFCLRHLRSGDCAIDVGANIGYYSILLSRCVLRLNGCSNVVVHPLALADAPGRRALYLCPSNRGDHRFGFVPDRDAIVVPVTTGDRCLQSQLPRLDFVKLDVQGAEELVLRGMRGLIEKNRQSLTMLVELCPSQLATVGSSYSSMLTFFDEIGGRYFVFDRWSPNAVSPREIGRAEIRHLAGEMLDTGTDILLNLVVVFSDEAVRTLHKRSASNGG